MRGKVRKPFASLSWFWLELRSVGLLPIRALDAYRVDVKKSENLQSSSIISTDSKLAIACLPS
jgi:hypothetical protein